MKKFTKILSEKMVDPQGKSTSCFLWRGQLWMAPAIEALRKATRTMDKDTESQEKAKEALRQFAASYRKIHCKKYKDDFFPYAMYTYCMCCLERELREKDYVEACDTVIKMKWLDFLTQRRVHRNLTAILEDHFLKEAVGNEQEADWRKTEKYHEGKEI